MTKSRKGELRTSDHETFEVGKKKNPELELELGMKYTNAVLRDFFWR